MLTQRLDFPGLTTRFFSPLIILYSALRPHRASGRRAWDALRKEFEAHGEIISHGYNTRTTILRSPSVGRAALNFTTELLAGTTLFVFGLMLATAIFYILKIFPFPPVLLHALEFSTIALLALDTLLFTIFSAQSFFRHILRVALAPRDW
jgi:hypothetical protein